MNIDYAIIIYSVFKYQQASYAIHVHLHPQLQHFSILTWYLLMFTFAKKIIHNMYFNGYLHICVFLTCVVKYLHSLIVVNDPTTHGRGQTRLQRTVYEWHAYDRPFQWIIVLDR